MENISGPGMVEITQRPAPMQMQMTRFPVTYMCLAAFILLYILI